jgi:hypothetical protein
MGVLIVAGTVTLVWVLVQRMGGLGAGGGQSWEAALHQPAEARIAGVAAGEGGIAVWVSRPDGDRVLVLDPKRGRLLGVIRPGD